MRPRQRVYFEVSVDPSRPGRPSDVAAIIVHRRGIELLRQLVKEFPTVPDYRLDLCEALGRYASSNCYEGRAVVPLVRGDDGISRSSWIERMTWAN